MERRTLSDNLQETWETDSACFSSSLDSTYAAKEQTQDENIDEVNERDTVSTAQQTSP